MNQLNFDLGTAPGIKAARPTFDKNFKWDAKMPRVKRLVDEYIKWCDGGEVDKNQPNRPEYEWDIISCFNEMNLDGYHLAKHLEEKVFVDADAELVELLGGIDQIKRNIKTEIVKKWVIDNDMKLPDNIIGSKCKYKLGFASGMEGYITTLNPETYEVCIDKDKTRKGGYVVPFENVNMID
jgi:hypothetical protein